MTTNRYGVRNYDDDPVWATQNNSYDYQPRHVSPYSNAPHHSVIGGVPSNNAPQQTTIVHSSVKPVADSEIYRVGIYGWRKRCLYVFILLLTIVIVINLALTIWIMMVLNISSDGMGALKISDEGIKVEGRSEFDRTVKFSQLSAPDDQALFIDSNSGVYISAKNVSGHSTTSLNLSPDGKSTAVCERFEVMDPDHKLLFFVDSDQIGFKLEHLRILDDGGSVFEGAIQTASIQPEPDVSLRLESPTRNLDVDAGQDIELSSNAGEVQLNALLDINLNSKQGEIHLDAGSIYMSNLERSSGVGNGQYQLCICQNGRLFLAAERVDCRADHHMKVERAEEPAKEKIEAEDDWSINRMLLIGFLIRVLFIFYANIHDYMFKVKFTDIDYTVYSDAALHVYNGRSPFARATYRYSPFLAYMVLPNVFYADFGKFLFSLIDILTGWLIYLNGLKFTTNSGFYERFKTGLVVFWLFNPFIIIISSRGNADTIVCSCIALVLYLINENQIILAAIVHGILAIHLRIYPVIYLPSLYFYFGRISINNSIRSIIQKSFFNIYGIIYCLVCILSFMASVAGCYYLYGQQFLDEYLLYHIRRQDVKHNFSPYFYPIYLTMDNPQLSSILGFGAFIPQLFCILYFAIQYSDDLPFCWFVTTFSFVALNKVCTSQYFVWYIMYLPLICYRIDMCFSKAIKLIVLWFFGQAIWLLPAYLLEFQGWNVMEYVWLASLCFLGINLYILRSVCSSYAEFRLKKYA